MENLIPFPEDALEETLQAGEVPESLRTSAERVVVLWTQDWCPQWHDMRSWIAEETEGVPVYYLVYNTRDDFERVMEFKEEVWQNREIPYVRYYKSGELAAQHNWLPRRTFSALMKK